MKSSAKPAEAKKAGECLPATRASPPKEEEEPKEFEVNIPVTGLASADSVAAPRPRTGGPTWVRVHSVVAAEERSKTEGGEEEGREEEEEAFLEVETVFIARHSLSSPPAGHLTLTSLSATLLPGLPQSPSRWVSSCSTFLCAPMEAVGASMAPKRETSIEGGGVAEIIF